MEGSRCGGIAQENACMAGGDFESAAFSEDFLWDLFYLFLEGRMQTESYALSPLCMYIFSSLGTIWKLEHV